MNESLRLLLVDDDVDMVEAVLHLVARSRRVDHALRVESCEGLDRALRQPWDAVLCKDAMPHFDALTALAIVQERARDVPFIILTEAVGEEAALDYMRLGAHDVVRRSNLARLAPALARELAEAKVRAQLRRSEELLLRSQRLRAVGEMAAGVAHDVCNLLNPVYLGVQLAQRGCTPETPEDIARALADIKRLIERAVETVERLRDYSKPVGDSPERSLDLNALVAEACDVARPRIASRGIACRLIEDLGSPPSLRGLPGEVLSALVNLVFNAIDAMPGGGAITLRTGEWDDGAFVSVGDDGPGMPPEVAAHAFDPFFTTKGDGTGLGLATVQSCMELHGGRIVLDTAQGRGARFTLHFPCRSAVADGEARMARNAQEVGS